MNSAITLFNLTYHIQKWLTAQILLQKVSNHQCNLEQEAVVSLLSSLNGSSVKVSGLGANQVQEAKGSLLAYPNLKVTPISQVTKSQKSKQQILLLLPKPSKRQTLAMPTPRALFLAESTTDVVSISCNGTRRQSASIHLTPSWLTVLKAFKKQIIHIHSLLFKVWKSFLTRKTASKKRWLFCQNLCCRWGKLCAPKM